MLYPYQLAGVDFLTARSRGYLADEMGLGKSVQACVAALRCRVRRALVVAPASTLTNWEREWATHGPSNSELVTVSYDRLARYPGDYHGPGFDLVILDEAHYCKTPGAKRTRAALAVAAAAPRAWLLSGTPMPNNPTELWAPIRTLWPELTVALGLTSAEKWLRHWCHFKETPFGRKIYGVKNKAQLAGLLHRIMLRRSVEQVADFLPPLRVDVSLLPRDIALDRALANAGFDAEAMLRAVETHEQSDELGAMPRLRRMLGEYKAPRIGEIIAEELRTEQYRQIVVLAHHHSVLDILRSALGQFGVVGFHGGTPQAMRQFAIDTFTAGTARVFLAQQTSAGIGINLQTASEVVLVEPAWSPDDNRQAIKRVHRIGQDRPCRARVFAVAGSLDEAVMGVCARKAQMQTDIGL
jgi:SWI/SNF-related matrix-associated actin-dependent regulator of chromatin subfamily A-like protein 1